MKHSLSDTIAAQATPVGPGGIGIIRISGPNAQDILHKIFTPYAPQYSSQLPPRQLILGQVHDNGQFIDEGLAVSFPAPHSYTAEDVVEIQCHGGPLLLKKVLRTALQAGARLAQGGEFSLRAFLNGRLDLTQAEAVIDLINAKTETSLTGAGQQLKGALYQALLPLEEELLNLLARVAAAADFPEEVEAIQETELAERLKELYRKTQQLLEGSDAGRIYREGLSVVLAGPANVGKSSLLNAFLQEERAIVTATAGTTRDVIEEYLNLDGLPILLSDTAGIRKAQDEAEAIGIGKSRSKASAAQLLLLVVDSSLAPAESFEELLAEYREQSLLVVLNKQDIGDINLWTGYLALKAPHTPYAVVSAKTGEGLDSLKQIILDTVLEGKSQQPSLINNLRQQESLLEVCSHLEQAIAALENGLTVDLAGIDLDNAWQALGSISGKTAGEDVINRVFENFCVGK